MVVLQIDTGRYPQPFDRPADCRPTPSSIAGSGAIAEANSAD
jgi:hypothetical protein